MAGTTTEVTEVCASLLMTLERPLVIGGKTIPAGTEIMVRPQPAAHTHTDTETLLAGYQTQLVRYADRQTRLEAWAAANGYEGA